MELKIIGSLLVLVGVSGIGISLGMKEWHRTDSLKEVKGSINIILSELLYNKSLFYEAVKKAEESSVVLKEIYKEVLKGLDNNNSVYLSWKFAFEKYKNETYLSNEEIKTITNLGQVFSSPDYNYQKSEINSFIDSMEEKIKLSSEKSIKDSKLYRSMSISIAAFVVVLLF